METKNNFKKEKRIRKLYLVMAESAFKKDERKTLML